MIGLQGATPTARGTSTSHRTTSRQATTASLLKAGVTGAGAWSISRPPTSWPSTITLRRVSHLHPHPHTTPTRMHTHANARAYGRTHGHTRAHHRAWRVHITTPTKQHTNTLTYHHTCSATPTDPSSQVPPHASPHPLTRHHTFHRRSWRVDRV